MSIKNWPIDERPGEKFLSKGGKSLTDAELLAIFLRAGLKGLDAVSLARQVLVKAGGLSALLNLSQERFVAIKGMGEAKFIQLQASLELSRRLLQTELQQNAFFDSTQAAKDFFRVHLKNEQREVFVVAFLNSQYQLLQCETLFYGTINAAQVYVREVVKASLLNNAAAVVLAHNHPSGSLEPSDSDKRLTDRIKKSLKLIDIQVLDHIIVGNGAVSFAELGLI